MTTIGSPPPATVPNPSAQPAPVAAKPQAAAAAASSYAAFKTSAEMVEFGEKFLDNLISHLGGADGARFGLQQDVEHFRKTRGDEFAEEYRERMESYSASCERMAQTDLAALRGAFSVSGELIARDAEGRRMLGAFTLSGQGPGYAVRIDSEKGVSVSNDGGPFTADFARITPPQLRNLPYLKAIIDTLNVMA